MKLPSSIAQYLCLFCTWLSAAMGLFLASSSHSYEVHIKGAEILSGQVIEGGLIIARTDPSNQVTLADDAVRVAKNGVLLLAFIVTQIRLKRWRSPHRKETRSKPRFRQNSVTTRFSESTG